MIMSALVPVTLADCFKRSCGAVVFMAGVVLENVMRARIESSCPWLRCVKGRKPTSKCEVA
jgi:hypothetical protein